MPNIYQNSGSEDEEHVSIMDLQYIQQSSMALIHTDSNNAIMKY